MRAAVLVLCAQVLACKSPQRADPEARKERLRQAQLSALPYMAEVPVDSENDGKAGVTRNDPSANPGLNLFILGQDGAAFLMDMEGKIRHRWDTPDPDKKKTWQHVLLRPGGELYVLGRLELLKLDWNSKVLLRVPGAFHHDLDIADNGDIFTIERVRRRVRALQGQREYEIVDDTLVRMDASGKRLTKLSVYDVFGEKLARPNLLRIDAMPTEPLQRCLQEQGETERLLCMVNDTPNDIFHVNSIAMFREPIKGLAEAGDFLISIRNISTLAIVSPEGKIRWQWGSGIVEKQHSPSVVAKDALMLFDNEGLPWKGSRVIEIKLPSGAVSWTYQGDPPSTFYSKTRGAAQRLPDGNTLITESDKGHVFEVRRDGSQVWEYWSEQRGKRRASIYKMTRIPAALASSLPP